ncbi:hypothetical protein A10D4_12238 [Idiomarina xiamenensis 10-D-4]|uniref:Succinylglutamate desuccinylase n=2 Tax=Idiomarina xiamenensis TaxID=1207041 RepID=K2KR20_9GAMM|nr:hypothetical protein A10D4_12238 [Idiomarina xiamenensis 10-D-4]
MLAHQTVAEHAPHGEDVSILTRFFDDGVNAACWQRSLSAPLQHYAQYLCQTTPLSLNRQVDEHSVRHLLERHLPEHAARHQLIDDVQLLVAMAMVLFDANNIGLRLRVLDNAMCPKFHVDKLMCRWLCTYHGAATEWLANDDVARQSMTALTEQPRYASCGEVMLLKGEAWPGNAGNGLVHRSPAIQNKATKRLLLSLDPMSS